MALKSVKKVHLRRTAVDNEDIMEVISDHIHENTCSIETDGNYSTYRYSGKDGSFVIKTEEDNGLVVEMETADLASIILLKLTDIYGGYIKYVDGSDEDYERDLSDRIRLKQGYCAKNDYIVEISADSNSNKIISKLDLFVFADYHEYSKGYGCKGNYEVLHRASLLYKIEELSDAEIDQVLDFLGGEDLSVNCGECI